MHMEELLMASELLGKCIVFCLHMESKVNNFISTWSIPRIEKHIRLQEDLSAGLWC